MVAEEDEDIESIKMHIVEEIKYRCLCICRDTMINLHVCTLCPLDTTLYLRRVDDIGL